MGPLEITLFAGGATLLVFAARRFFKGPRCRYTGSCRVAVVGDSITAGGIYVDALNRALPRYEFDNYGVVGEGTAAILQRLRSVVLPRGYDEIIILAGGNDLGRDNAEDYIANNIGEMVRAAKSTGARVVLLSMTPWSRAPSLIRRVNRTLLLKSPLWRVDDFVDVWKPLADRNGGLRREFIGDQMGVHPNRAGHEVIAEKIFRDAY